MIYEHMAFSYSCTETSELRYSCRDPGSDAPVRVRVQLYGTHTRGAFGEPLWPFQLVVQSSLGREVIRRVRGDALYGSPV